MTHYRATFSNGRTVEIRNSRKPYTHAWGWAHQDHAPGEMLHGFSTSAGRAAKNMEIENRFHRKAGKRESFREIVAVEVVS